MTDMFRAAHISPCGRYRWSLPRIWDSQKPMLGFVMLNPSTADGLEDDPTIRRCIGQAQRRGFGGIIVTNLFAFRATSPDDMKAEDQPVGVWGTEAIISKASESETIIAGWGTHGTHRGRDEEVKALIVELGRPLYAVRLTKDGHPGHPLYIPYDTELVEITPNSEA